MRQVLSMPCKNCKTKGWYIDEPCAENCYQNNLIIVCDGCSGVGYITLMEEGEYQR